jgi:hypothetical protein
VVLSRGAFLRQCSIFVAFWFSKKCEILDCHSGVVLRQRSIFVALWLSNKCEILDCHSGVAEVSSLPGCDAVTLGK